MSRWAEQSAWILACKMLWVVNKTGKALNQYSPFSKQQPTIAAYRHYACKQRLTVNKPYLDNLSCKMETNISSEGRKSLWILVQWKVCSVQLLTSVDVNILPQSLILLQVLQEVLVLSEDRKASWRTTHVVRHYRGKIFTGYLTFLAHIQTIHQLTKTMPCLQSPPQESIKFFPIISVLETSVQKLPLQHQNAVEVYTFIYLGRYSERWNKKIFLATEQRIFKHGYSTVDYLSTYPTKNPQYELILVTNIACVARASYSLITLCHRDLMLFKNY